MNFYNLSFLLLLIVLFSACNGEPSKMEDTFEKIIELPSLLEFDLEEVKKEGKLQAEKTVNIVYDPVFKRAKTYNAIPLKPYLEKLIQFHNLDIVNTEIIFSCKDGYNPSLNLAKVMGAEPFLATKDLEAPEGQNWMDTLQGKWAPFYLIWPNHAKNKKGYTWPYGLKFIQFKASNEAYKAAFPIDESMVIGFELFKAKCMKCHSVNKVGGEMGPEFNIPRNITEYWKKEDIIAFVKAPYSYRYNSKMPPVKGIKEEELEQILGYLQYMKGHKINMQ